MDVELCLAELERGRFDVSADVVATREDFETRIRAGSYDVVHEETRYISPAYEEIRGRSCRSLYENPRSFLEPLPAEDRDRLIALIARMQQGEQPGDIDFRVVRKRIPITAEHHRGVTSLTLRGQELYV